jgi:hypothetical protein
LVIAAFSFSFVSSDRTKRKPAPLSFALDGWSPGQPIKTRKSSENGLENPDYGCHELFDPSLL